VLEIEGEEEIVRGTVAQYSCTTGKSYPQPDVTVSVTDEIGDPIETISHDEEYYTEDKAVSTKVQFSFQVPDSVRKVTLHCESQHPAGDAKTSVHVPVLCKSVDCYHTAYCL
jgi:hypothetical protein